MIKLISLLVHMLSILKQKLNNKIQIVQKKMYCNNKLKIKFTKKYLTKLMNFPSIFQIKHNMKEKCYKNSDILHRIINLKAIINHQLFHMFHTLIMIFQMICLFLQLVIWKDHHWKVHFKKELINGYKIHRKMIAQ